MTASVYGYITAADLEAFDCDYSAVLATYTDVMIEAQITQAERMVNVYCHQSFTGTIPDGVVAVTTELAFRLMHNKMLVDGQLESGAVRMRTVIEKDSALKALLSEYILTELDCDSIDIIPLSRSQNYR